MCMCICICICVYICLHAYTNAYLIVVIQTHAWKFYVQIVYTHRLHTKMHIFSIHLHSQGLT